MLLCGSAFRRTDDNQIIVVPMICCVSVIHHFRSWFDTVAWFHEITTPLQSGVMSTKVLLNFGRVWHSLIQRFGKPNNGTRYMFVSTRLPEIVTESFVNQPLTKLGPIFKIVLNYLYPVWKEQG